MKNPIPQKLFYLFLKREKYQAFLPISKLRKSITSNYTWNKLPLERLNFKNPSREVYVYESLKLLTLPSDVCAPKEIPAPICLLKLNEGPPKLIPDSTLSP